MHQLAQLYHSKQLHHAYFVVVHKTGEFLAKLEHFFENIVHVKTHGNPDYYHGKFGTLTIDDARSIAEASTRKSLAPDSPRRIFVIEADFINHEAQNALLKILEEPTPGVHFFIISPQDMLLPTLRSRVHRLETSNDDTTKTPSILNLKLKERLAKVKEITEAISDEEKTKQDAIALLNQIESEIYSAGIEKFSNSLKICESARASLYDRGAPVKMILENVMISI